MNNIPNMVENQRGSIESTQSMAMNVTLKPQKIIPGALTRTMRRCGSIPPSRSSTADQWLSRHESSIQPPR